MDSFYDAPRRPPTPTRFEKINVVKSLPVPEISIIAPEKPPIDTILKQNNEILLKNSPQSRRVHFQGTSNKPTISNNNNKENLQFESTKKDFNLNGKTFKHIYMANIPNRDLDSSLLEPNIIEKPKIVEQSKRTDESIDFGRNFREFRTKFPITNTKIPSNHKIIEETSIQTTQIPRKIDKSISCNLIEPNNNLERLQEPTIKDLLEIIKQQNQQIISLQQQLFNLQNCLQQNNTTINQQQQSKKFSIDLKATSFEVSFRPQKLQKFQHHEPTIKEIIESSNDNLPRNCQDDLCLNLQQSIDIREETCPSPTPSIRIDMEEIQDYKSDDYDNSDDLDEEEEEEIGVSLYENIMSQVNKILENVRNQQGRSDKTTVQEVKEATIRCLKDAGMANSNDYRKLRYKPSDVSFAVKQLLLKYLPDEQLVDFQLNQTKSPRKLRTNKNPMKNEFSIASLEYMKKYNLLNDRKTNKFLDISTLKLQPKLL